MLASPAPSASEDPPPAEEPASGSAWRVRLLCGVAALGCALAWLLPAPKPAPGPFASEVHAFGRYSYSEFVIAVVASAVFLSTLWLALTRREKRRVRLFQLAALWLGSVLAVGAGETLAHLVGPSENPFYTFNEGGVAGGAETPPDLRYVRPPNLTW